MQVVLLVPRVFVCRLSVSDLPTYETVGTERLRSAAIAIRAPNCAFASPAFHGMTIVCDISAAAREGCRAKKGLPILIRLRKRAQDTLVAASAKSAARKPKSGGDSTGTSLEEDDLSHLVSAAKLRRVVVNSPPTGRAASLGHTPTGSAGNMETPSPTAPSAATSATLAEPLPAYEGAVPPFPTEEYGAGSGAGSQSTPHGAASTLGIGIHRPSSPGSAMAEQILLQQIGPSMGGFNWPADPVTASAAQNQNFSPSSLSGFSFQGFDANGFSNLGNGMGEMDMDMSMALGMGMGGVGGAGGMLGGNGERHGMGMVGGFDGVGGGTGTGQGTSAGGGGGGSGGMEGTGVVDESMEFDFDALLNGMTGSGYE